MTAASVLHGCDVRTMTFKMVSNFRMRATKASFFGALATDGARLDHRAEICVGDPQLAI